MMLINVLLCWVSVAMGMFFSVMFTRAATAFELAPAITVPFLLCTGLLCNSSMLTRQHSQAVESY